MKEYDFQYKIHMYNLHQIYLQKINETEGNFYINKFQVINYLNSLDTSQLMYALNYHLRDLNLYSDNDQLPDKDKSSDNDLSNEDSSKLFIDA